MTIIEAIKQRNSVRNYTDERIDAETIKALLDEIAACNKESGLHMQLVTDEPGAFSGIMARYGKFKGVSNYISLIGVKGEELDGKIGYYGERIVLKAQQLGLNTCWVAMTYSKGKSKCKVNKGEKLVCTIALGYGVTQGVSHKSKPIDDLCKVEETLPEWFRNGMEAAALAPTAVNQQKFMITLDGNKVTAKPTGGYYSKIDIGIVKYHFEIGAGKENFIWE